jgi:exosortase A-associated hydrolase 2
VKRITLEASYVDSVKGRILLSCRRPAGPIVGCVLVAPPFADEMNKSRRMLSEAARALAGQGIATVIPDLYGTGDAEGDFADASWETWLADLQHASEWASRHLAPVTALIAVRLGAELGVEAVVRGILPPMQRTVLWQPVFDSARFLTQFLRLRTAAKLTQDDMRESVDELKQQLLAGQSLEVAGYRLNSALARALSRSPSRAELSAKLGRVFWTDLHREVGSSVMPVARKLIDASLSAGIDLNALVIAGEPFWSSTEIACNRALIAATVEALS